MKKAFPIILCLAAACLVGCGNSKPKAVELDEVEKRNIYEGRKSVKNVGAETALGIGRSVNALTDSYIEIEDTLGHREIFDENKLVNDFKWTRAKLLKQEGSHITGSSASSYYDAQEKNIEEKIGLYFGKPKLFGIFTAGIQDQLAYDSSYSIDKNTSEIITEFYQNIVGYEIAIEGFNDSRPFREALSDNFTEDIEALESGELSFDEFFTIYGTHVVLAGYYGGRIEATYQMLYNSCDYSESEKTENATQVELALAKLNKVGNLGNETSFSISKESNLSDVTMSEHFSYKGKGGRPFASDSMETFMANYPAWVQDFRDNPDDCSVLVDVPKGGLMPIWELLDSTHGAIKEQMMTEFETRAGNKYNEFVANYTHPVNEIEDPETYQIEMEPKSCAHDNNYDATKPEEKEISRKEVDPKIVDVILNGCVKQEDGKYKVVDKNKFDFGFKFVQDTKSMNCPKPEGSGVEQVNLSEDKGTSAKGTNINEPIKHGAYWFRLNYSDSTTSLGYYTCDFMNGKVNGDYVAAYSAKQVVTPRGKHITSIDISVVYEIDGLIPGLMSVLDKHVYTDWRCDLKLEFVLV